MTRPRRHLAAKPRRRLWIETLASTLFAVTALLTLIQPAWIEIFTGLDPDTSSGAAEVTFTLALAVVALASGVLARLEWRRNAITPGQGS